MAQTNFPPLTTALKIFLPLAALNTAAFIWLTSSYVEKMPRHPQPETGRIHDLIVDRGIQIFVTESESAWYSRLNTLEFLLVFCLLISAFLWKRQKSAGG